jgi:hypothetical protein
MSLAPIRFLKIQFNIIFPFTLRYSRWFVLPQVSPPILSLFTVCTLPPNIQGVSKRALQL